MGYRFTIGKKVIVIGGGNVAMDVARSAAREVLRQHAAAPTRPVRAKTTSPPVAAHEMVDVSLSALRMGAQEVGIVCLEKRNEMPAALEEIEEAQTEGIVLHDGRGPHARPRARRQSHWPRNIEDHACFRLERPLQPRVLRKQRSVIECDTVILAIGQAPNLDFLQPGRRREGFAARIDRRGPRHPDDLRARACLPVETACSARA